MRSVSLFSRLARHLGACPPPVSRRAFLRASAAAGAALLLSRSGARAGTRPPRVVIVGAGLAGLSCAYELFSAGITPVVLEARGRVGGRVRSVADPKHGHLAEAGGEFIGEQHHVWGAYARRFNLPLVRCQEITAPLEFVVDGRRLEGDAPRRLYEEMRVAFARIGHEAQHVNPAAPWESPDAAARDSLSVARVLDAMDLTPLARRVLDMHFANENAVPTERSSWLGLLAAVQGGGNEAFWTQTEAFRCRSGNQQLAHALAAGLPAGALIMRHPVHRIERRNDVTVVHGNNGARTECDICVLAVPPGVWSQIDFEPALPADLLPQMGPAIKHLAWFDAARAAPSATMMVSDYFGTVWPMLRTPRGPAGDVFFCASEGAARYRALDKQAREVLRASFARDTGSRTHGGHAPSVATRFIDWPGQRFTGGGYSFPAPGEVTRCGPVWQAGLGALHFIGEYTHYAFIGYMEGALRSGVRMAAQIAAASTTSNRF